MTTMTMSTSFSRTQEKLVRPVSQLMPLLLAIALQTAAAVVSVLMTGPMH